MTTVPTYEEWEPLLIDAQYDFSLFDGLNRFYLARERPELKPALGFPADNYTRATDIWTRGSLEIKNAELKQHIETLEAEISRMRSGALG